ncbi:MAG: DNA-protecting protein DprA, partial [Flavobacteriaceae bacterium]
IKTKNAHLLSTPADVAYILNWSIDTKAKPIQKKLFINMKPEELEIYNCLKKEGRLTLDLIALQCKMPTSKAAYLLMNLELNGAVRPLPGKEFELA